MSLIATVNKYLGHQSPDRIGKQLRATVEDPITEKTLIVNPLSKPIRNPFIGMRITQVQALMRRINAEHWFQKYGSIAICASCGSGKTLAGIYAIFTLQCKTLIVSTRNAVIDQWYRTISTMFPELKVFIRGKTDDLNSYDIWICTPQYLGYGDSTHIQRYVDPSFNINPSLIIYDEVHTMLGDTKTDAAFINVLKYPFMRCLTKQWSELPYMLALSATYPKVSRELDRVFGVVHRTENSITDIPIHIYDVRDDFKKRGKCDANYAPLTSRQVIWHYLKWIPFSRDKRIIDVHPDEDELIGPEPSKPFTQIALSTQFKGVIMTYLIDESVWTALTIQRQLHANVLLIRANDETDYFIPRDLVTAFHDDVSLSDLSSMKGVIPCKYIDYIHSAEIIVSTVARLKEGFSCENLVWGICTQFVWSPMTRVQIAGRIRRSSTDEALNKHVRRMYVSSHRIPSTLFKNGRINTWKPEETYDWEYEKELFKREHIDYFSTK